MSSMMAGAGHQAMIAMLAMNPHQLAAMAALAWDPKESKEAHEIKAGTKVDG
jgi:septum formation inhibitor MinC